MGAARELKFFEWKGMRGKRKSGDACVRGDGCQEEQRSLGFRLRNSLEVKISGFPGETPFSEDRTA